MISLRLEDATRARLDSKSLSNKANTLVCGLSLTRSGYDREFQL